MYGHGSRRWSITYAYFSRHCRFELGCPVLSHLFRVLQDLLEVDGVKTLFFGDIRSYPLHREFLAARALHIAGENAGKDEI